MFAIEGSTISNRDELLDKLIQAVKDLDPTAMVYFSEHQPDKNYAELAQVIKQHDRILNQLVQAFNKANPSAAIDVHSGSEATALPSTDERVKSKSRARAALREVRRALNDFRDNS
jgi:histidinol phosphatase-like PHP family hydrolase